MPADIAIAFAPCIRAGCTALLVAVFLTVWHAAWYARGAETYLVLSKLPLLTFFVIVPPLLAAQGLARRYPQLGLQTGLCSLAGFVIVCLMGVMQRHTELPLFTGIVLIDVGCVAILCRRTELRELKLPGAFAAASIVFLLVFVAVSVWDPTVNPGDALAAAADGSLHIDVAYHSAICGMLRTYGVPSGGLHGIEYLSYHWGVHWVAAQLAAILDTWCLETFSIVLPIVLSSLFCFAWLLLVARTRAWFSPETVLTVRYDVPLLLCTLAGGLPLFVLDRAGAWVTDLLRSHSYLASMTSIALVVCTAFEAAIARSPRIRDTYATLVAPLMLICTGMIKISSAFILAVALGTAALQHRVLGKRFIVLGVGWLFVSFFVLKRFVAEGTGRSVVPFDFVDRYTVGPLTYFSIHYIWLWVFLLACTAKGRQKAGEHSASRLGALILPVIAAALGGGVVANSLEIVGGSGYYFSDPCRVLAIAALAVLLPSVILPGGLASKLLSIVVLTTTPWNTIEVVSHSTVLEAMSRDVNAEPALVTRRLIKLRTLSEAQRRAACVYVPESFASFWKGYFWRAAAGPYVLPAVSEIAAIDAAPYLSPNAEGYTFDSYRKRHLGRIHTGSQTEVRAEAAALGCQRLYSLNRTASQ